MRDELQTLSRLALHATLRTLASTLSALGRLWRVLSRRVTQLLKDHSTTVWRIKCVEHRHETG